MKHPPFKLDGRGGAARWTSPRTGRSSFRQSRVSYEFGRFLQAVLSGDCDGQAEMRLERGPWHRVEATVEEAREALLRDPLMRARVTRLERRR